MCEFHLQGNCFHPQRIQHSKQLATQCNVLECSHCTNRCWQRAKIKEELEFYNQNLNESQTQQTPQEPLQVLSIAGAVYR